MIVLVAALTPIAAIGVALAAREIACWWKHGVGVPGAVMRYNRIQKKRWEDARRRARENGEPHPAPYNKLKMPEL